MFSPDQRREIQVLDKKTRGEIANHMSRRSNSPSSRLSNSPSRHKSRSRSPSRSQSRPLSLPLIRSLIRSLSRQSLSPSRSPSRSLIRSLSRQSLSPSRSPSRAWFEPGPWKEMEVTLTKGAPVAQLLAEAAHCLSIDDDNNPRCEHMTSIYCEDDALYRQGKWTVENLYEQDVPAFVDTFLGKVQLEKAGMVRGLASNVWWIHIL
jgi:hypothetical protein